MSSSQTQYNSSFEANPPYLKGGNSLHYVRACEVSTGCVLWLPRKDTTFDLECKNQSCGRCDVLLEAGAYDHPVVVLKSPDLNKGREEILVAIITSFRGTSLETYLYERTQRDDWDLSLPIAKVGYAGNNSRGQYIRMLGLEGKRELRVQSYVNLRHHCWVPLSRLRQYGAGPAARAYDFRLTKTSYRALMKTMDLVVDPYLTTQNLRAHTKQYIANMKVLRNQLSDPIRGYETSSALRPPLHEYFENFSSEQQSIESQNENEMVSPDSPELQPILGASRSQETFTQQSHQQYVYSISDLPPSEVLSHEHFYNSTLPRWQTSRSHHLHQDSLLRKLILKPLRKVRWNRIAMLLSLATFLATGYGLFVLIRLLMKLIVIEYKSVFILFSHQWHSLLAWNRHLPTSLPTLLSNLIRKFLHTLRK